jgi:hypothetical protein
MPLGMRADARHLVVRRSVTDSGQRQRDFNELHWGSVHSVSTLVCDFGQMRLRSGP